MLSFTNSQTNSQMMRKKAFYHPLRRLNTSYISKLHIYLNCCFLRKTFNGMRKKRFVLTGMMK